MSSLWESTRSFSWESSRTSFGNDLGVSPGNFTASTKTLRAVHPETPAKVFSENLSEFHFGNPPGILMAMLQGFFPKHFHELLLKIRQKLFAENSEKVPKVAFLEFILKIYLMFLVEILQSRLLFRIFRGAFSLWFLMGISHESSWCTYQKSYGSFFYVSRILSFCESYRNAI